jgi:hypothetical protein
MGCRYLKRSLTGNHKPHLSWANSHLNQMFTPWKKILEKECKTSIPNYFRKTRRPMKLCRVEWANKPRLSLPKTIWSCKAKKWWVIVSLIFQCQWVAYPDDLILLWYPCLVRLLEGRIMCCQKKLNSERKLLKGENKSNCVKLRLICACWETLMI